MAMEKRDTFSRILPLLGLSSAEFQMLAIGVANHSRQDIIAILGMDELSEEDKLTVARARKAGIVLLG